MDATRRREVHRVKNLENSAVKIAHEAVPEALDATATDSNTTTRSRPHRTVLNS
jgi:hypothetical protein